MAINSSEVYKTIPKSGGIRKLFMRFFDDREPGTSFDVRRNVPDGVTDQQIVNAVIAELESEFGIEAIERARVTEYIQAGGDPAGLSSSFLTNQQLARTVVRAMMKADDLLAIMPTAKYIQSNISNAQLANWFGVENGTKVRNRTDRLVSLEADLIADRDDTGEI